MICLLITHPIDPACRAGTGAKKNDNRFLRLPFWRNCAQAVVDPADARSMEQF